MAAINFSVSSLLHLSAVILLHFLSVISEAKVVNHTFEVYYFSGSPDGIYKDKILGINGQFPGPTIEANVGDTLQVTLVNKIQDGQNTTLHWHGMHQRESIFEDGTSQIAQCPLPFGSSQVYRFTLTDAGTYWYHSHVNSQYTEGLFGALVVHSHQEAHNSDGEITLSLSDWYHRTAHENEAWYLSPASLGISPYPDAGLINGLGRYPCEFAEKDNFTCDESQQFRPVFTLQQNATSYRVRVINSGAVTSFNFSIDGHILETVEVDGIDVAKPVPVDVASISPGQRYTFIVRPPPMKSEKEARRFLIRATVRKEWLMLIEGTNINEYPHAMIGDVTAVLHYVDQDLSYTPHLAVEGREEFSHKEIVPPPMFSGEDTVVHLNQMDLSPLDGIPAPDYFDEEYKIYTAFVEDEHKVKRASFNQTPFQLPHDQPLLMTLLLSEEGNLPSSAFPLEVNYGSVVQLVVDNPFFGSHPFHLHGHHFWVVGLGEMNEGSYDSSRHSLRLDGVKRDTVVVPEQSYAVIRFVADNPGIWTFHCHMDWHNLSGMALTFVEGGDVLRMEVQPTEEALRICALHQ